MCYRHYHIRPLRLYYHHILALPFGILLGTAVGFSDRADCPVEKPSLLITQA